MTTYPITPCPAPRMTRSDKWKKRPCVMRYFAFRDACRAFRVHVRDGDSVTFTIPFPASYNAKKRASLAGTPHRQKPDLDNMLKALFDAIFDDDCHISSITARKVWGATGSITIS